MSHDAGVIRVDAAKPGKGIDWREIWNFRELLWALTQRDITARYQNTSVGVLWALAQPAAMMLVFTFIFGRFDRFSGGDVPYAAYVMSGYVFWMFFSNVLGRSGGSILGSRALITKVYFPRLIIPFTAVGAPMVDYCVANLLILGMVLYFDLELSLRLLCVPFVALIAAFVAVGVGCFMAALSVVYRDFQHVLQFATRIWMFMTPIIYPPSFIPLEYHWLHWVNPIGGIVAALRWAWFGTPFPLMQLAVSLVTAGLLFYLGSQYFRAAERKFVDAI